MSAEVFRVDLLGPNRKSAIAAIISEPFVSAVGSIDDEEFVYDDGLHVIELVVFKKPSDKALVSCRFALCHPSSVDEVFTELLLRVAARAGMTIRNIEDPGPGSFPSLLPSQTDAVRERIAATIAPRRAWWISVFGGATAGLTSEEAIRRYIMGE